LTDWLRDVRLETVLCLPADVTVALLDDVDLVIVDAAAMSPDPPMSICRWLRGRTDVPLLATTRPGQDPLEPLRDGADMVLRTDCGAGELVARVRALLRRTPPRRRAEGAEEVAAFAGLQVDRAASVLSVGDEALGLDEHELAAVWLLVVNGPRVTRRATLAAAFGVDQAELDDRVRKLRQRLESLEGWRRLVALRGVGFRLLTDPSSQPFARPAAAVPALVDAARADATSTV
jgi:DNA-binding response OmpR family regulator